MTAQLGGGHNHRGPICHFDCPLYDHEAAVKLPEGDCGCTWSGTSDNQTAICAGHKALSLLELQKVEPQMTEKQPEDIGSKEEEIDKSSPATEKVVMESTKEGEEE